MEIVPPPPGWNNKVILLNALLNMNQAALNLAQSTDEIRDWIEAVPTHKFENLFE